MSGKEVRHLRRTASRGFTLIEVLVASLVLAIGIVGAILGLISAAKELRYGELRQVAGALAEAKSQALISTNKLWLASAPPPYTNPLPGCSTAIEALSPGTAPWVLDPTSASGVANDLAEGAFFKVLPNGQVSSVSSTDGGWTSCASAIPTGMYCREVALCQGMIDGGIPSIIAAGGTPYTYLTRVSRAGDPLTSAVINLDVFVE
jgi:prepilin-type N-terminal cleavage/methylation domain-containing protein